MRRGGLLAILLVIYVMPTGLASAQEVRACVKDKQGQVRVIGAGESCLPSEHLVQWSASSGSGTVAAAPATNSLRVVDARGTTVGFYGGVGVALRKVDGMWVSVPVGPAGIQASDPAALQAFYVTTDCTGDAYLPIDATSVARTAIAIREDGGVLALYYPNAEEVGRESIKSTAYYLGTEWKCSAFSPGPWMPTFGKIASIDLSAFQGPFTIAQ